MVTPARVHHPKPFTATAVVVLVLIALLQLLRFLLRWEVTLNGAIVPVWLSGVAFVVAAGLAVLVWRENRP
jgi:high-affinity Fe2+/Pb2+ permease